MARVGPFRIVHAPAISPQAVLAAISAHRIRDREGEHACLKWGWVTSVSHQSLRQGDASIPVAVKQYRWRGVRGALSDLCWGSRPARAFRGAELLDRARVSTPTPLAMCEWRRFGVPVESFLLARFSQSRQSLTRFLLKHFAASTSTRTVALHLGDLVGMLHAQGLDHRDLKHSNILVDANLKLTLLDAEAVATLWPRRWSRTARALAQLEAFATHWYPGLPRTDRTRFLKAYFRHQPELCRRRRRLLADVQRRATAKIRVLRAKTKLRPETENIGTENPRVHATEVP